MTIKSIEVRWLESEHHCEACGWSYEAGAEILINGATAISMKPSAHCLGGTGYSTDDVYKALIDHLCIELGFTYKETH